MRPLPSPTRPLAAIGRVSAQAVLLASIGLVGCGQYVHGYNFAPKPGEVTLDLPRTPMDPDARVLASITGIRRNLPTVPGRQGLEIRLRVENLGPAPVRLDPGEVVVLAGSLELLRGPINPREPIELTEGDVQTVLLTYALPEDVDVWDDEMEGVHLRVPLRVDERTITRSIAFQRRYAGKPGGRHHGAYPYGYPHYHVGVGVGYRYGW